MNFTGKRTAIAVNGHPRADAHLSRGRSGAHHCDERDEERRLDSLAWSSVAQSYGWRAVHHVSADCRARVSFTNFPSGKAERIGITRTPRFRSSKGEFTVRLFFCRTPAKWSVIRSMVVLSDWTDENPHEVLRWLKRGSEWPALQRGNSQSVLGALIAGKGRRLLEARVAAHAADGSLGYCLRPLSPTANWSITSRRRRMKTFACASWMARRPRSLSAIRGWAVDDCFRRRTGG